MTLFFYCRKRNLGILFALTVWMVCSVSAQETSPPGVEHFDLLAWPEKGSFFDTGVKSELRQAWHGNHLHAYIGRDIQFISTKTDSLEKFLHFVQTSRPECIEGDPGFIEREINRKDGRLYIPLLRQLPVESPDGVERYGEIVFLDRSKPWAGLLGVVHPYYGLGGGAQIDYWRERNADEPKWQAFYSSREVLRHLFVGSVQAAAVPEGALDEFLHLRGRDDLVERATRVRVPVEIPLPAVYLREDFYNDPLRRTLISETWLRNCCPNRLGSISRRWP